MAKPDPAQVRALEIAHKGYFVDLVIANHLFIIGMLPKIKGLKQGDKKYDAVLAFGRALEKAIGDWYVRERNLEVKGKIPPVNKDIVKYFLLPKNEGLLVQQAKEYIYKGTGVKGEMTYSMTGMGIIPLIIWGVIAIAAAFTAYEVIHETEITAHAKEDLLIQTQKTLKDLNISGNEAADIINKTQQQASTSQSTNLFSGITDLVKPIGIGLGIFFLLKIINQNKTSASHG